MSKLSLVPYLFFKGNCREAIEFYKSIFGGQLEISTYGDVNAADENNSADKIMNASLTGGEVELMASDTDKASDITKKVELALVGDDEAKLTNMFERLSEGASVRQNLKKEFWGDTFGQLTDKYGVDWMVNISNPNQPS